MCNSLLLKIFFSVLIHIYFFFCWYYLMVNKVDYFPRSILVTSSRGCHEDATRKTATMEFKVIVAIAAT